MDSSSAAERSCHKYFSLLVWEAELETLLSRALYSVPLWSYIIRLFAVEHMS